mgnify:CR=1 FL=1|tara:strand:+ start:248 stop:1039 length:792 start_codon:yes stop_codon:yes gene_type:complete
MLPLAAITLGQAGLGAMQVATSGASAREKELDALAKRSPFYKGSKSIDDYYQQALNRYSENPYQSQQYQLGAMNVRRSTAQGLSAFQDRRAIGGISRLAEIEARNLQNLGGQAEAQRNARFGQLGGATQMKTGEEYKKFDINQMTPFNRQLQLAQYKAQAANERRNAGMQMISGAASNAAIGAMYGGFDKTPKVSPIASATSGVENITGSPFSKYGADFSKYGVGNKGGFNSRFGKNYLLPKLGGLPVTNNYPMVDEFFAPEY